MNPLNQLIQGTGNLIDCNPAQNNNQTSNGSNNATAPATNNTTPTPLAATSASYADGKAQSSQAQITQQGLLDKLKPFVKNIVNAARDTERKVCNKVEANAITDAIKKIPIVGRVAQNLPDPLKQALKGILSKLTPSKKPITGGSSSTPATPNPGSSIKNDLENDLHNIADAASHIISGIVPGNKEAVNSAVAATSAATPQQQQPQQPQQSQQQPQPQPQSA